MRTMLQDVRLAWRRVLGRPGVASLAVVTMALGIGANTAIFSLINGILLRPLPYAEPDRLVRAGDYSHGPARELRARTRTFERLALFSTGTQFTVTGLGEPERIDGSEVTADLFDVLGTRPLLGRTFTKDEDLLGQNQVVVLSYALWQQRFGGDPWVLGRQMTVNGIPRQVVGVMPRGFYFPSHESRLWVPYGINLNQRTMLWGAFGGRALGRLAPGVSAADARRELQTILPEIRKMFPWRMPDAWGREPTVTPIAREMVGSVETRLLTLLGAAALVLVIACVNVANLFLATAVTRRKEVAVQLALGASRGRLVRQFLTETLLVAIAGGALGVLIAVQGMSLLLATLPADTPRLTDVAMDGRVLLFGAAVTLLTGLAFGLLPAVRTSSPDLQQSLKTQEAKGHAHSGRSRRALSAALVVGEVALAVVVAIAAGLLVKSLWRLTLVDAGVRTERVITARLSPAPSRCQVAAPCVAFYEEVLNRLRARPDVQAAGATRTLPLSGSGVFQAFVVEDQPLAEGATPPSAWHHIVAPDYLTTVGIPLLRGRMLTRADDYDPSHPVLVNAALAQHFWPGQDPIGKRMRPVFPYEWRTVVGVVGNVRQESLARAPDWEFYVPYSGFYAMPGMTVVVRTKDDPAPLVRDLRSLVRAIDPDVPVDDISTMAGVIAASIEGSRATMWLLAGFAGLALLLGAVGIYGVISDTVSWRTREVGVRIALGARPADVRWLVMRQGLGFTLAGVAVGLAAAIGIMRALRSQLFEVSATDPATFGAVTVLLVLVALAATYVPARRATRLDPVKALRTE